MVSIILCRPEGSANIGAVCRAMYTMQLQSLVLIWPLPIDEEEVKKWSLKGFSIYQNARRYDNLSAAISDFAWVVGVSRRHGRNRKRYFLTPEEMAQQLPVYAGGDVALVFGNEKNGLNEEELRLCHSLLTIPADAEAGSLNLSHAVQICTYAVFRYGHSNKTVQKTVPLATQQQVDNMVKEIVEHMDEQGIFTQRKAGIKELTYSRLCDILGRVPLYNSDIKFLRHTLNKMIYADRHHRKN